MYSRWFPFKLPFVVSSHIMRVFYSVHSSKRNYMKHWFGSSDYNDQSTLVRHTSPVKSTQVVSWLWCTQSVFSLDHFSQYNRSIVSFDNTLRLKVAPWMNSTERKRRRSQATSIRFSFLSPSLRFIWPEQVTAAAPDDGGMRTETICTLHRLFKGQQSAKSTRTHTLVSRPLWRWIDNFNAAHVQTHPAIIQECSQ